MVIANEEERRIQAAANAAKKKAPAKGGKNAPVEEEKKEEEKPQGPPPKKEHNLSNPAEFGEALKEMVGRPFIFGPVEFTRLDQPDFQAALWRDKVIDSLSRSVLLPENLCIHGFQVNCKGKTLKRATTVVKHSRFLRNMVVHPNFPFVQEQVQADAAIEEAQKTEEDAE